MNINEFLEDWDNAELSHIEWQEQMEEAVQRYNEEYNTDHNPRSAVKNYISWQRDKNRLEE